MVNHRWNYSQASTDLYANNLDSFEDLLKYTAGKLENIAHMTHNMKNITPDTDQIMHFAEKALDTRYDTRDQYELGLNTRNVYTDRTIGQVLEPERPEDTANDAWTVFNRVQESVMRGGMQVLGKTKRYGRSVVRYKDSKPLTSIKQNVDVNRKLWDIAQEVLAAWLLTKKQPLNNYNFSYSLWVIWQWPGAKKNVTTPMSKHKPSHKLS